MRTTIRPSEAAFLAVLALLSCSIFIVTPMEPSGVAGAALLDLIRLGVAALVFMIVAKRRRSRIAILAAFVATTLVSSGLVSGPYAGYLRLAFGLAFDLSVATIVAAATFRPGPVSTRRITGGIILYLLLSIIFARLFGLAQIVLPQAFVPAAGTGAIGFPQLLNFSLASLTSVGEAEIVSRQPLVTSLAQFETVLGQLFPATLLARLVGLNAAEIVRDASVERPRDQ